MIPGLVRAADKHFEKNYKLPNPKKVAKRPFPLHEPVELRSADIERALPVPPDPTTPAYSELREAWEARRREQRGF